MYIGSYVLNSITDSPILSYKIWRASILKNHTFRYILIDVHYKKKPYFKIYY